MNKVKKIEKRLSKLRRLQKQLEKKKRKVSHKVAERRKKQARALKAAAAKKAAAAAKKTAAAKKAEATNSKNFAIKVTAGIVIGTLCGIVASKAVKAVRSKIAEQKALVADDQAGESDSNGMHAAYDKASLEELEDALLRVENELDEVSAAIERTKK